MPKKKAESKEQEQEAKGAKMTRAKQIGVRTFQPLIDLIQELADEERDRSLSWMIEKLLIQATAAECKKRGKSIKKIEGLL